MTYRILNELTAIPASRYLTSNSQNTREHGLKFRVPARCVDLLHYTTSFNPATGNPVSCLLHLLPLLLLSCCPLYLEIRVRPTCGGLRLTSSNCQTLNPHLRQMQGSWWYLLYKPRYSPFCPKFRCHGNESRSEENAIGSIQWLIAEPLPPIDAKISQISLTQAEL